MFILLLFISFLLVSACSRWVSKPTEQMFAPPVKVEAKKTPPPPVVVEEEPGTIWRPGSQWNEVYSVADSRKVGDVVFLRPTDTFRSLITAKGGKLLARAPDS